MTIRIRMAGRLGDTREFVCRCSLLAGRTDRMVNYFKMSRVFVFVLFAAEYAEMYGKPDDICPIRPASHSTPILPLSDPWHKCCARGIGHSTTLEKRFRVQ